MIDNVATKRASLVERLASRTSRRKIKWELDADRNPEAELGDHKITLSSNGDESNPIEYVTISDDWGNFVERFNDEDLHDKPASDYEAWWQLMRVLRTNAYRQAVGADRAIDSILDILDDDL